jgi:hypothetical protein
LRVGGAGGFGGLYGVHGFCGFYGCSRFHSLRGFNLRLHGGFRRDGGRGRLLHLGNCNGRRLEGFCGCAFAGTGGLRGGGGLNELIDASFEHANLVLKIHARLLW